MKVSTRLDLAECFERLDSFSHRDETGVQKIAGYFMERGGGRILAEALVAEGGLARHFFLSLQDREGQKLVRCYESTDPEKSPAVKRLVLRMGMAVQALDESSELDPCNLEKEARELAGD